MPVSSDLQCKTLMGSYTQGNDTYACSSSGCQISLRLAENSALMSGLLHAAKFPPDGTSCQGGGRCANGQCDGASVGKEITSWIQSNKILVAALASVIGGLLILGISYAAGEATREKRSWLSDKSRQRQGGLEVGIGSVPQLSKTWEMQMAMARVRAGKKGGGPEPPPPAWAPLPSIRYA